MYNKEELSTIYFALVDKLQASKKEWSKHKELINISYIDYLKALIDKTEQNITELNRNNLD